MSTTTTDRALYFERQGSGSCRLSAINNLFGKRVLDASSFAALLKEHESRIEIAGGGSDDDYIESTRDFVMSFILRKLFDLTSFWIAPFEYRRFVKSRVLRGVLDVIDFKQSRFFVMTTTHVWCVKKHTDGKWYVLDSQRSVRSISGPDAVVTNDNLGYLFPWGFERAQKGVAEMQILVTEYFGVDITRDAICAMLLHDLSQREPEHLGACQAWIALFFKYLKYTDSRGRYQRAIDAFVDYDRRREASPLDLVAAIETLPKIITFIINNYNVSD